VHIQYLKQQHHANSTLKTTNSANSILTTNKMQINSLKSYYIMSTLKIVMYERSSLFWVVTQRWLVFVCRYLEHPIHPIFKSKPAWPPLKMRPRGCPTTLVYNYKPILCNNKEERAPLQHGRNLKYHKVWYKILGSHSSIAEVSDHGMLCCVTRRAVANIVKHWELLTQWHMTFSIFYSRMEHVRWWRKSIFCSYIHKS
jgi:hypothetical protein